MDVQMNFLTGKKSWLDSLRQFDAYCPSSQKSDSPLWNNLDLKTQKIVLIWFLILLIFSLIFYIISLFFFYQIS